MGEEIAASGCFAAALRVSRRAPDPLATLYPSLPTIPFFSLPFPSLSVAGGPDALVY